MTNKHENKYENLVVHCKSKEEWDWVFEHLPEGCRDQDRIYDKYSNLKEHSAIMIDVGNGFVFYDDISFYLHSWWSDKIISFQEYQDMFLQDQQEEANQYHVQPSTPAKEFDKELYDKSWTYKYFVDTGIDLSNIKPEDINRKPSKPNTKSLELLSKNISTFTKAAKLAGIDEKELDSYSKLLIQLSAGGVELSWTLHHNA